MKPYYDEDGITIYCGDMLNVLPKLRVDLVLRPDLVLTDPPYGIDKAAWDDEFPSLEPLAGAAPTIAVMPGVSNLAACPMSIGAANYRWTLAAHLCNGMTRGAIGFGNWIPCLIYAEPSIKLHRQESDHARIVVGAEPKPDHPSPKPIGAVRWFLQRLPAGLVLDPFMGSGTTLRAAKDLGRRAIGIEIERAYCDIAIERLRQQTLPFDASPTVPESEGRRGLFSASDGDSTDDC